MRKLTLLFLFFLLFANAGFAADLRAVKLRKFLGLYPGSPLVDHINEVLYCADKFRLDYRLYVAISGAESGFGRNVSLERKNFTGFLNGEVPFDSIYHNIYKTHELIGTKRYYRKYRNTLKIEDLIYVYKAVPPFAHYIKTVKYVMRKIDEMPVDEEMAQLERRALASSPEAAASFGLPRYDEWVIIR